MGYSSRFVTKPSLSLGSWQIRVFEIWLYHLMFSISENYGAQFSTSANILIIFSNKYFNFSLTYLYFLSLLGKHQHIII